MQLIFMGQPVLVAARRLIIVLISRAIHRSFSPSARLLNRAGWRQDFKRPHHFGSMSATIDAPLTVAGLVTAYARQKPAAGLIVHSDRGSQYASDAFRNQLGEYQMVQSMSRRGNC